MIATEIKKAKDSLNAAYNQLGQIHKESCWNVEGHFYGEASSMTDSQIKDMDMHQKALCMTLNWLDTLE